MLTGAGEVCVCGCGRLGASHAAKGRHPGGEGLLGCRPYGPKCSSNEEGEASFRNLFNVDLRLVK